MSLIALFGAVELGLIYSFLAMGLFLSYRVLNLADLTVEGSFTLGAAVCAVFVANGRPILGLLVATVSGALAGTVTAIMQTKLKILPILAGILTMTALYSINIMIMGNRANLTLIGNETVFSVVEGFLPGNTTLSRMLLLMLLVTAVAVILTLFLRTRLGLSIRATGDNVDMVRSSSINPSFTTLVGLSIANALVSLSGGILAQYQLFADAGLGIGIIVVGLASLIIGEVLFGKRSIPWNIAAVIGGSIIYRILIALALKNTSNANHLKLISAVIVAISISFPAIKSWYTLYKLRREGKKDA